MYLNSGYSSQSSKGDHFVMANNNQGRRKKKKNNNFVCYRSKD